jgi:hypothetical protein
MMRLPCCSAILGLVMVCALVFSVCMPTGRRGKGWGPRAGWGRLLPARDSWPRVRRGSARKGGASRCFPRSGWKGSWGALAGGGAGPYAARPPPGTAPSLRLFPGGVAQDVRTGNTDKGTRTRIRADLLYGFKAARRAARAADAAARPALPLELPCRAVPDVGRLARRARHPGRHDEQRSPRIKFLPAQVRPWPPGAASPTGPQKREIQRTTRVSPEVTQWAGEITGMRLLSRPVGQPQVLRGDKTGTKPKCAWANCPKYCTNSHCTITKLNDLDNLPKGPLTCGLAAHGSPL